MEVDLVVPFVNNKDKKWQSEFVKSALRYNPKRVASLHSERFEDIGLIDYNLKLLKKFLPWVRKIFLLLACEGQEPRELPENVEVVYHRQFIPIQYLPTFNSTTIEMFLWNIKGLGERFLYINDDMLPLKPLKASQFFSEDKIKVKFLMDDLNELNNTFRKQCYNSFICFGRSEWRQGQFIRPEHSFTPMIKSHCKECFDLLRGKIAPFISKFRTVYNHNQYIYPIYEYYNYGVDESEIDFFYTQLDDENFKERLAKCEIVCPNVIKDNENKTILLNYLRQLCE